MRNAVVLLVLAGMAAVLTGFLLLRRGFEADTAPGQLETAVARRLILLSIPAAARGAFNPRAADPSAVRGGAEHFAAHCALCHGPDGRGATEVGPRMYPPVPDLAAPDIQQMPDGALFSVIQHGVRWTGMPAFRTVHSDAETWALVAFIRQIPTRKPADREAHAVVEPGDAVAVVTMDGTTFSPPEVRVKVGGAVTWRNNDPFPHNVMSQAGGFRSGDLDPERAWQFRANAAGRFPYVCTLHPGMKGMLIVEP